MEALRLVLAAPPPRRCDDVAAWAQAFRALARETRSPWDTALLGGAAADRLGYAFAAGYQGALTALVPSRDPTRLAALCATEASGGHPRAIATTLESGALHGEKTFVTLGEHAEELYVLARTGAGERAPLALVRVERDAPGVRRTAMPAMPFVPEIPHASVRFEAVRSLEVLPGDGWADFVRPFRTVEDVYVHGAVLAWLAVTAGRLGARALVERAAALLVAFEGLATGGAGAASSPVTHVALAGAIELAHALVRELEPMWDGAPADERERWRRDRVLLEVAGKARGKRIARAWERLAE